jgi:hypothetical protein
LRRPEREHDPGTAIQSLNSGEGHGWTGADHRDCHYDRAISLNPRYAKAFNNRGYVWDDKRDYDRAIQDYDRAMGLNPKYVLAGNADIAAAKAIDPQIGR